MLVRVFSSFCGEFTNSNDTANPWATNFPILNGEQEVQVPAGLQPGNGYKLVCEYVETTRCKNLIRRSTVFGDSGNDSQPFKIEAA